MVQSGGGSRSDTGEGAGAAARYLRRVREIVRVLRFGSREAILAVVGFLLVGSAAGASKLESLPFTIPSWLLPGIWSTLGLIGFVCLALSAVRVWRRVVAPLPEGGPPKVPALKGAGSFGPTDAELYSRLGRTAEIERLRSWILDSQRSVVVLMGESGTGKTSLLRAGLAPLLAGDDRQVIYWEALPMEAERGLLHAVRSEWRKDEKAPESLPDLARDLVSSGHVLIMDQIEQLTTAKHPAIYEFIREIALATPPTAGALVVAFRRENSANWVEFELDLPPHARHRVETLSLRRFSRAVARKVVAVLVEEGNLPIEQRVVEELVEGLAVEGGVSPVDIGVSLLALGQLTSEREEFWSLNEFRETGGEVGLLTRYLEEVLEDSLRANEKSCSRPCWNWLILREISALQRVGGSCSFERRFGRQVQRTLRRGSRSWLQVRLGS